jgi:hypothetical protein
MTEVDQVRVESTAKELNKAMSALETSNDEESSTTKLINKVGKLNLLFLSIPIVILIALAIRQPKFVTKEVKDPSDSDKNTRVLNYNRLLIVTLCISLVFPAAYYGYTFYYKKN